MLFFKLIYNTGCQTYALACLKACTFIIIIISNFWDGWEGEEIRLFTSENKELTRFVFTGIVYSWLNQNRFPNDVNKLKNKVLVLKE